MVSDVREIAALAPLARNDKRILNSRLRGNDKKSCNDKIKKQAIFCLLLLCYKFFYSHSIVPGGFEVMS
jgi:hypothetical protein